MGVRKLMYISPYDFKMFENWLSSMASQGLFLSKIRNCWCIFDKNKPQDIEYRAEVESIWRRKKLKEVYSNNGWQHICGFGRIHVFGALKQEGAKDVHTKPEEYVRILNLAIYGILWDVLFPVIALALAIFDYFKIPILSETPWLNLLSFEYSIMWILVLYLSILITSCRDLLAIRSVKRAIIGIKDINQSTVNDKKTFKPLTIFGTAMYMLSYIIAVLLIILSIKRPNISTLTLENNYDIIRLNDIEKLDSPLVDVGNYAFTNEVERRNLIIYKAYDAEEAFLPTDEKWNNKEYSPFLKSEYYELYLKLTAKGVTKDIVHETETQYGWFSEPEVIQVEYDGLDEAYYIEGGKSSPYTVVARKGNRIIKLSYSGKQPYTKVLEAAVKKL